MNNPTINNKPKTLGDLLIKTNLKINATLNTGDVSLGTPLNVIYGENGYEASVAEGNEANGILLESVEAPSKVAILLSGEIKESFYEELSKELKTSLLNNHIILI